jgi:PAS domain S-box-containing protein
VASIGDALVVCDEGGRIVDVNPSCSSLSGYAAAELVGQPIALLFPDQTVQPASTRDGESRLITKERRSVPVRLSISSLRGQGGRVVVARDLTERHRLEAELRQAHKMEAVGRLAGGVAHDFNNMMTIILGYAVMLLDGMTQEDPLWEPLSEVRIAAERSAELTHQLLAFSRQQKREAKLVELNDAVERAADLVTRTVGPSVHFRFQPSPEACRIEIEPRQLEEILVNLAANARDAMGERGGTLTISVGVTESDSVGDLPSSARSSSGRLIVLTVSDDGCGMDRETQARIFDPFFTTKEQGRGLGLSTVFGIIRQSHGHIHVSSQVNVGSTFKVYLPESSVLAVALAGSKSENAAPVTLCATR